MAAPHDAPDATELVAAVREWLEREPFDGRSSASRFNARVAVNVLSMVEREIALGPAQASRHRERLAQLGCADDEELARKIRDGDFVERLPEVRALVFESICDKLAVANPSYATDESSDGSSVD
ncbi:MAG: hypothetical protein RL419_120 [Actinomycetota bacterium]|jgi:hypothetical protein